MKQTNVPVGSYHVPRSPGKYLCLLALALFGIQMSAGAQQRVPEREITGPAADKIIKGAYSIKEGPNTSFPAVVMLSPDAGVSARNFVPWFKQTMKVAENVDFILLRKEHDNSGMEHHRFVQTFRREATTEERSALSKTRRRQPYGGHAE